MTKWSYLIEADDDPKVKSVVKMLKAYDVRRFTHWKKALDLVNTLNKGGPSYILVFHTPATSQYAVEWMTVVKPIPDGFEVGLQKHGRYPTGGSTKMSLSADSIEDPDSGLREFTKFGLFKRGPAGGWRSWA